MALLAWMLLAASPQEAAAGVREALGALEKALAAPDESLEDHLDLPRLLLEMERRGSIPEEARWRGVRRLGDNLAGMTAAPGIRKGGWEKIRPLSVRPNEAGTEAVALCRVTLGGRKATFRFWLTSKAGGWKTYDLENIDGSYKLSVIALQYTPGVYDEEERYALRDGVQTLQRGALHLAEGKPEGAIDAMAMARGNSPPEFVMSWIDLVEGQAFAALLDPEAALKCAQRALVKQKDLAQARRLQAASHLALKEPAKAAEAAKEYLALMGDEAGGLTLLGEALERLDRVDEAAAAYRKAADFDEDDVPSRMALGRLLIDRGRATEAAAFLSAAARLDPEQFEAAADLLDGAGAPAAALGMAEEAVASRPDDAVALHRLGRALRELGRCADAEKPLRRAAEIDPREQEFAWELAFALAQGGKDAEAQEWSKAGQKGVSDWFQGYIRAFVHAAAGRSKEALEDLKPALKEEGWTLKNLLSWVESESVFERVRSLPEARALLEPARATRDYWMAQADPKFSPEEKLRKAEERIRALPGDASAHQDRGILLRKLGKPAEAVASYRKANELYDNKTQCHDGLGRALAEAGKLEEALAVADVLMKKAPRAEEFGMDLRVSAYAIAGKREAALEALKELLDRHPEWVPAAMTGDELADFRRLPATQDLLRKARAKLRK